MVDENRILAKNGRTTDTEGCCTYEGKKGFGLEWVKRRDSADGWMESG